jgi:hypothetical protein
MNSIRDSHSSGKIDLKFYLVEPKYKKRQIAFYITTLILVIFLLLILLINTLNSNQKNSVGFLCFVFFLLIIPQFILGKILLRFEKKGTVKFKESFISFKFQNEEDREIQYLEILKIEYCGGVRSDFYSKSVTFKSYKVRLKLITNELFDFEATNDMFLTHSDLNINRSLEPTLLMVLNEIKPKFGIIKSKF